MGENTRKSDSFLVLCDGESDRRLFCQLKAFNSRLSQIPEGNVQTYDQARNLIEQTAIQKAIGPLHQDDRPDWIFCYQGTPVLVVEITRHAYTGDNGLQRFARFAAAAEQHVPFVYFGPLRRVRDDELGGSRKASPRSLTSDVFEGMKKLAVVHSSPQLFVEWKTDRNGLPISLPFRPSSDDVNGVFGILIKLIDEILFDAPLCTNGNPLEHSTVRTFQDKTNALAEIKNTRASEVKFSLDRNAMRKLVLAPSEIIGPLKSKNYFDKGKPDKTLALYALTVSKVLFAQMPNEKVIEIKGEKLIKFVEHLLGHKKFNEGALVYYTGYKWRSDPHCGVLVNMDYRLCRQAGERTPIARSHALVVVYPRISLNQKSQVWASLKAISETDCVPIKAAFELRYGKESSGKLASCIRSNNLFSLWNNRTKQARLFRRYADLLILNDGIIVGDGLAAHFNGWDS
jgi:hypothetical protein